MAKQTRIQSKRIKTPIKFSSSLAYLLGEREINILKVKLDNRFNKLYKIINQKVGK